MVVNSYFTKKESNFIMLLIFLFPFFYIFPFISKEIGHFFENIYFFALSLIVLLVFFFEFYRSNKFKINLKLFLFSFGLTNYFIIDAFLVGVTKVTLFYFTSVLIAFYAMTININLKFLKLPILIFLILITLFLYFDSSYIDNGLRYKAFFLSPTHFSIYVLTVYSFLALLFRGNIFYFLFFSLISFLFIYLSQTRLSILVFLILFFSFLFFYFKKDVSAKIKSIILFICHLFFLLLYPLYGLFTDLFSSNLSLRYEGEDNSFLSRVNLLTPLIDRLEDLDVKLFFIGEGGGSSRKIVYEYFEEDLFSHYDFISILIDHGFFVSVAFFFIIIFLGSRNNISFALAIIYISSFYHNMIYSYYLFFLLLFTSLSIKKEYK